MKVGRAGSSAARPAYPGAVTMRMRILDPSEMRQIIRRRRSNGADRYDEVWDGVYIMSPLADIEHQELATLLSAVLVQAIGGRDRGTVLAGTNVSDREKTWKRNFRCPDVAVFLPGNSAANHKTHWCGGPDFAVEITSPRDRSRKKGAFYAKVGTRELLVIDRKPWSLELYRSDGTSLNLVGESSPDQSVELASTVLPLNFRMIAGEPRPRVEVSRSDRKQTWIV
jgi:Uma2 family endonuclease